MTARVRDGNITRMLHDIHACEITNERLREGRRFSLVQRALAERRERRKSAQETPRGTAPRPETGPQGVAA